MVGNNANGWDLLAHDYKSLEPETRTLKKKGSKGLGLPANPWIRVRCECGYEISKPYPYPSIPLTGNTRCYPYPCHALRTLVESTNCPQLIGDNRRVPLHPPKHQAQPSRQTYLRTPSEKNILVICTQPKLCSLHESILTI
jgi:hypothetical protein